MDGITRVEKTYCKTCNGAQDSHGNITGDWGPKENDVSVCLYCGTISLFDKDLNLIAMPEKEMDVIRNNEPDNWRAIEVASEYIKERIAKN